MGWGSGPDFIESKTDKGILYSEIEDGKVTHEWEYEEEEYANGGKIDIKLKDWYKKNYPTDELGEEMNDTNTFENLEDALNKGDDVYNTIGVGDSVIRERLFEHLAKIKGEKYEFIYQKWLGDGMITDEEIKSLYKLAKGGKITTAQEYHKARNKEYEKRINTGIIKKDTDENFMNFDEEYFNELVNKGIIDPDNYYAKGGATKGKMKLIEEEYAGSGQKAKYRGLYNYEGDKLRVDINVDTSYAKQSSSGVYIYNKKEKEWNFLASIPWENMKTTSEISPQGYSHKVRVVNTIPSKANGEYRKKLIQDAFDTDRDTLLKKAEMILSDKFAKGGSLGDRFKEYPINTLEVPSQDAYIALCILREGSYDKKDWNDPMPLEHFGHPQNIRIVEDIKGMSYIQATEDFTHPKVQYLRKEFKIRGIKDYSFINGKAIPRGKYAKGGKVKKGNEMIMGGIAGILLGVFLNK